MGLARKILRFILQELDKRFPEVVKVDLQLHLAMKEDIKMLALAMDELRARVDSLVKKQEIMEVKRTVIENGR
jgi:hypothetical protein